MIRAIYYEKPAAPVCPEHGITMSVSKSRETYRMYVCRVFGCNCKRYQSRNKIEERRLLKR